MSYGDLQEKYPEILGNAEIRVLPGWHGILDDLCAQLVQLGPPHVEIRGVYEKFGALRLHESVPTEAQKAVLCEAYVKSQITCENCGKPAKNEYVFGEKIGAVKVLCPPCLTEYRKR